MQVFVIACVIHSVLSLTCQEEMVYQKPYGYIYKIACSKLNNSNIRELKNIATHNQVKLIVDNSTLTNVTSDAFMNIPNTIQLIIKNSIVTCLDFIPTTLRLLSLANNSLTVLTKSDLVNIHQLRFLNLSYNSLSVFPPGILRGNIEELDLSHNKYENFNVGCEVNRLSRLRLSHNSIKTLEQFPLNCFPLLNHLYLDFNLISQLPQLKSLSYLTKLILNNNDISAIGDTFSYLENLSELNLAGNKIIEVAADHFLSLPQLITLNLKQNCIKKVVLSELNIVDLNLENNNFERAPNLTLSALKTLRLSHNPALSFIAQSIWKFDELTGLSLRNCGVNVLNVQLQNLTSLTFLDLSFNALDLDKGAFANLENLRDLDLSWNQLSSVPSSVFSYQSNLEKLNLSHNNFKKLDEKPLDSLLELRELDLSFNRLECLNENIFKDLYNLQELHVSHNQLKVIEYDILLRYPKKIRYFDIRYNNFSCPYLMDMLGYFNANQILFGAREQMLGFDENIAGIHCQESKTTGNLKQVLLIVVAVFLVLSFMIIIIGYRYYFVLLKNNHIEEFELINNRNYCYRPLGINDQSSKTLDV